MAFMDFIDELKNLDPERAKIALRLKNIKDNVQVAAPVAKEASIVKDLSKPLDVVAGAKKVGGVSANIAKKTAPVLLNPAVLRVGGAVQAGAGGYDMAKNGVNLANATDVAAGGLQVYNPLLGGALNTGLLLGKGTVSVADKFGALNAFKPKEAVQGPAFAAAQAKFKADPRPQDVGYTVPKYPTPQIAFTAEEIARGDIPQAQFTEAELAAMRRDVASRTMGAGGGGGGGGGGGNTRIGSGNKATMSSVDQPSDFDYENAVLVDRGGVQSMDIGGERSYAIPNQSPEDRAVNLMKYLSSEAQKVYNDTTIKTDTYEPVTVTDVYGDTYTEYVKKTNVTPGINIANEMQQQISGVAPIPYAERVANAKNATDIEQAQIGANATLGSAQIQADASITNNDNSMDAVKAALIKSVPKAQQPALAVQLGAFGAGGSSSINKGEQMKTAFDNAFKDSSLEARRLIGLYNDQNPSASYAELTEKLLGFESYLQNAK